MFEREVRAGLGYVGYVYAVTGRRAEAEALAAKENQPPGHPVADLRRPRRQGACLRGARAHGREEPVASRHLDDRPEVAILRDDPRFDDIRGG